MERFFDITSNAIQEITPILTGMIQDVSDNIVTEIKDNYGSSYDCQDGPCMFYSDLKDQDGNNPTWTNETITLEGNVPEWLKGDLVNACASDFQVGKYTLNYVMDGFVRYNRYRFDGKNVQFSSKIVDDSKYWIASQKAGEPEMALFYYPTPKRLADRIPGISMAWCTDSADSPSICDNIGIQPTLMPDGKTSVWTTDSPIFLKYDRDDLSNQGWLEWNSEDFETSPTGATHVVTDITTGDMLGLLTEMKPGLEMKFTLTFYRITAEDIHKRIRIGSFDVGKNMPYYHSFGHTDKLLIYPHNSINFDVIGMMEGHPMDQQFEFTWDQMFEFVVMNIEDGTTETYTADHSAYVIHTGNCFLQEDGKLVYEAEMYVEAEIDPFKIMDRAWLLDPKRAPHHVGARLRRYYIDLETKEITFNDMLKRDTDTLGFVEYNPRFAAKETRYTYIVSLDYNENKTMLHQYDSKTGTDKTWSEDDIYLSEPQVIVDPDNHGELDMLIVFSIYDHKIENNRMVIIDCNTLEPISDTVMPTRLPMTLHQYWYAAN